MTDIARYHDDCGSEVVIDDHEEPCWWCAYCQDTVDTEDTHVDGDLVAPDVDYGDDEAEAAM